MYHFSNRFERDATLMRFVLRSKVSYREAGAVFGLSPYDARQVLAKMLRAVALAYRGSCVADDPIDFSAHYAAQLDAWRHSRRSDEMLRKLDYSLFVRNGSRRVVPVDLAIIDASITNFEALAVSEEARHG